MFMDIIVTNHGFVQYMFIRFDISIICMKVDLGELE